MQYRPARAFGVSILLAGALLAAPVHADIGGPCMIGSGVSCPPPIDCVDDADCFGRGLGRCVTNGGGGGGGVCSPDCNSLFACNSVSDCPSFDPLIASCQMTSISGVPGVCTYHDPTDHPFVTVCGSGASSTVSLAQVRACFAMGSWANGDCDGDGVLNNVDANPCGSSVMTMVPAAPVPFCLAGQVCEGVSSRCLPFLHCSTDAACNASAARMGTSAPWSCASPPGPASPTFCQPTCDATVHCTTSADCRSLGTCRFVSTALSMCVATALTSCASSCSSDPLDWASAQGDCDGDGAQNGCDGMPCGVSSPMCFYNHVCSIDAGVGLSDGGVITIEAGVRDASNTDGGLPIVDASVPDVGPTRDAALPDDAATIDGDASTAMDASINPADAGSSAMDASTGITATPGLGFGGGGGCRCAVVGGESRDGEGAAFLALLLAGVLARRSQRVRTRR